MKVRNIFLVNQIIRDPSGAPALSCKEELKEVKHLIWKLALVLKHDPSNWKNIATYICREEVKSFLFTPVAVKLVGAMMSHPKAEFDIIIKSDEAHLLRKSYTPYIKGLNSDTYKIIFTDLGIINVQR